MALISLTFGRILMLILLPYWLSAYLIQNESVSKISPFQDSKPTYLYTTITEGSTYRHNESLSLQFYATSGKNQDTRYTLVTISGDKKKTHVIREDDVIEYGGYSISIIKIEAATEQSLPKLSFLIR